MKNEKVAKTLEILENIDELNGDIYEVLGIVIDDVHQMFEATDRKQFLKEKKDARNVIKSLLKRVSNTTFADREIARREKKEEK